MDPLYFIIFGAVILVAIYLTYYFVSKQLEKDHLIVQQIKNILEQYGKLDENGHHPKFTFNEQSYYVKFLKIKPNVKFKFNSKTIWEKRFSGKVQYTDQRSEEHTSELQSRENLVCRLLLEKKKK